MVGEGVFDTANAIWQLLRPNAAKLLPNTLERFYRQNDDISNLY